MLALLAVTIVQVLHSHASGLASSNKNIAASFSACDNINTNSSCFICDYQLTKEADNSHATYLINCSSALHITAVVSYTFTAQSIYPVFETRGPPAV
ncbi:hypothetical protein [Ferruginibacter sp.]|nr:hypothetical protein [Ferruginibacter sp.]